MSRKDYRLIADVLKRCNKTALRLHGNPGEAAIQLVTQQMTNMLALTYENFNSARFHAACQLVEEKESHE